MSDRAVEAPAERLPLRVRLALYDLDGVTLLVLPAVLFVIALFVYPFAYGFVLSSNYNSRPRAAEVLVEGAAYRVVRRRETFEDLVRGETV